jgi:hypothetical protein
MLERGLANFGPLGDVGHSVMVYVTEVPTHIVRKRECGVHRAFCNRGVERRCVCLATGGFASRGCVSEEGSGEIGGLRAAVVCGRDVEVSDCNAT